MAHSEARVAPSSIFSATPRGRAPGIMATNTPSAPVLIATGRPAARISAISSVQARPSPATSSGWATIASRRRTIAAPRAPDPSAAAKAAMARASPASVQAKLGAEHPSTAKPGEVSPVTSSKAARTARCTGWVGST